MVGMSFSSDLPLLSRAQNVLASEFEVVVVSIASFYFSGFFVGGRSLDGDRAKDGFLPWPLQMNIIVETASGLAYLYAYDIIQRDVNTRNILLNNNYHVKVTDFRLSRLSSNDAIHVSTAPQGTSGYVDLQYHECYQLTDKTDFIFLGLSSLNLIPYKRCGEGIDWVVREALAFTTLLAEGNHVRLSGQDVERVMCELLLAYLRSLTKNNCEAGDKASSLSSALGSESQRSIVSLKQNMEVEDSFVTTSMICRQAGDKASSSSSALGSESQKCRGADEIRDKPSYS
ncbi:hypothetical protein FXO37_05489 [Capsicum annuum]|nr:hypothetical protein FXO37_05489 [Capsicum annuum]